METLYPRIGWAMLGLGCFTQIIVLSPRYVGWPLTLLLIGTGWSMIHRRTLLPRNAADESPVGLRPLREVLGLQLICLAIWGAGLALRLAQWGYLPAVGVQKGILCFGVVLCLLAAHELAHGWRWVQLALLFAVQGVVVLSWIHPRWFQLPAHESTWVQLGIAALAMVYLLLLVARRWVVKP